MLMGEFVLEIKRVLPAKRLLFAVNQVMVTESQDRFHNKYHGLES